MQPAPLASICTTAIDLTDRVEFNVSVVDGGDEAALRRAIAKWLVSADRRRRQREIAKAEQITEGQP
jgi:hypothetical protein